MHLGGVLVGSIVSVLLLGLIAFLIWAVVTSRREIREIHAHLVAERRRRNEDAAREHEELSGQSRPRHLRVVRKMPPTTTVAIAGAVAWELVRRHRPFTVGMATTAAGLSTTAMLFAPPLGDPPADAVQPTTTPHAVVHTHHGQPTGSPVTSAGSVKHPSPRLTAPVKRSTSAAARTTPAAGVTPTPSASVPPSPPAAAPTTPDPLPVTSAVGSVTSAAPSLLPTDVPITSVLPSICLKLPAHKHCI